MVGAPVRITEPTMNPKKKTAKNQLSCSINIEITRRYARFFLPLFFVTQKGEIHTIDAESCFVYSFSIFASITHLRNFAFIVAFFYYSLYSYPFHSVDKTNTNTSTRTFTIVCIWTTIRTMLYEKFVFVSYRQRRTDIYSTIDKWKKQHPSTMTWLVV